MSTIVNNAAKKENNDFSLNDFLQIAKEVKSTKNHKGEKYNYSLIWKDDFLGVQKTFKGVCESEQDFLNCKKGKGTPFFSFRNKLRNYIQTDLSAKITDKSDKNQIVKNMQFAKMFFSRYVLDESIKSHLTPVALKEFNNFLNAK